jgi:hypothetical protein
MKNKKNKILQFITGIGLIALGFIPEPTDVTIVLPIAMITGGLALIKKSLA